MARLRASALISREVLLEHPLHLHLNKTRRFRRILTEMPMAHKSEWSNLTMLEMCWPACLTVGICAGTPEIGV